MTQNKFTKARVGSSNGKMKHVPRAPEKQLHQTGRRVTVKRKKNGRILKIIVYSKVYIKRIVSKGGFVEKIPILTGFHIHRLLLFANWEVSI